MATRIMREVLCFIKLLFRPAIHQIRKWQLRSKFLADINNQKSAYSFTKKDVALHIEEIFTPLSTAITVKTEDVDLVTVAINAVKIYWPASQSIQDLPWLFHEVFDGFSTNPSSYDNPNLDYKSKLWIMDAGAAEGYFSIFALGKSSASLICIEPLPIMKIPLEKTLELHSNGKPFNIVGVALSDKIGWADIEVNNEHVCDSKLLSRSDEIPSQELTDFSTRVAMTTIDQLASDYNLGANGLIKMDIEGYEMLALMGAEVLMREFKPSLAIAVYHDLDNAILCAEIIKKANQSYKIEFRGFYGYFQPPRPYMIFAY